MEIVSPRERSGNRLKEAARRRLAGQGGTGVGKLGRCDKPAVPRKRGERGRIASTCAGHFRESGVPLPPNEEPIGRRSGTDRVAAFLARRRTAP